MQTTPEPRAERAESFHVEVNDRCGVKREDLAHDESTDNGDAERLTHFRAVPVAKRKRHGTEKRRERSHENGPKAQEARAKDRILGGRSGLALFSDCEIDHQNRVLFDDADEQNNADECDDREICVREEQRKDRPASC